MAAIDWAILSDFSQVAQTNLLHVIGGGWDTAHRPHFPAPFNGALAVRILFTRHEVGRPHQVELDVVDEDGRSIAPTVTLGVQGQVPPGFPMGWDIPLMFVSNMHGLQIPQAGRYAINIMLDGHHVKSVPFQFVQAPPRPESPSV
jgi:hypothetical protein